MAKKILVVDDEKDIVEFMSSFLEDNGYQVNSAGNGVDAMESIEKDRPDLILLDLQMPEETGTGLYRKLRNKKELREIPIIIVSGLAGRNIAVSKTVVVLDKPLDQAVILKEIEKALS